MTLSSDHFELQFQFLFIYISLMYFFVYICECIGINWWQEESSSNIVSPLFNDSGGVDRIFLSFWSVRHWWLDYLCLNHSAFAFHESNLYEFLTNETIFLAFLWWCLVVILSMNFPLLLICSYFIYLNKYVFTYTINRQIEDSFGTILSGFLVYKSDNLTI